MSARSSEADKPPREADRVRQIVAPSDGELAEQVASAARAFNSGDYRAARLLGREVLRGACSAEERAFAEQILYRTGTDPAALIIGGICLALLVAVALLARGA